MKKQAVIFAFIQELENEIKNLSDSARAAHEAATHEEAKAEDKHDTRAIEASYLADGQARRIEGLRATLLEIKSYLDNLKLCTRVEAGALLTLRHQNKITYSLFCKLGGGTAIELEGKRVNLLTHSSPLGEALQGGVNGDEIEVEVQDQLKTYRLEAIS